MEPHVSKDKLTIYRRHSQKCKASKTSGGGLNCDCPLWAHGKLKSRFVQRSLDTRLPEIANQKVEDLLNPPPELPPHASSGVITLRTPPGAIKLVDAANEFLTSKERRGTNTQTLYRRALVHFLRHLADQGITRLKDVDTPHLRRYFADHNQWKRNTAHSRLTHLRVFFNFCRTKRWIVWSPAADSDLYTAKKDPAREPFTTNEISRILEAVGHMPESERDRARAAILMLLYTGVRISDLAFAERAYVTAHNLYDYCVIKTRRRITLPPQLQPVVLEALAKLPPSRVYFFQPDREDDYERARKALRDGEEFQACLPDYTERVACVSKLVLRVLALAKVKGTCHKFRDTFAINLLTSNADNFSVGIYTVSKMLGHSDVKITEGHYLNLIPGYRERLSHATRVLSYVWPNQSDQAKNTEGYAESK